MKVFTTNEVRRKGLKAIARSVFRYLSDCEYIYVSFDVDSLGCVYLAAAPARPVSNGLKERGSGRSYFQVHAAPQDLLF